MRHKRRRLRLVVIAVTLMLAAAFVVLGCLQVFTDFFILRQSPIERISSPEGGWELRVYEEAAGSNHSGS